MAGDNTRDVLRLARALRGVEVAAFVNVRPAALEVFFRLRPGAVPGGRSRCRRQPVGNTVGDGGQAPLVSARRALPLAAVIQPVWGRCGSTTVSENQIDSLLRAGHFVVRLFQDGRVQRGPTLDSRLSRILPENQGEVAAHVNVAAVPEGPWPLHAALDEAEEWLELGMRLVTQGKTTLTIECRVEALSRADAPRGTGDDREREFGIRAIGLQTFN